MELASPAFAPGEQLPERFTKDDENTSPPLRWDGVPPRTVEFVLVFENLTGGADGPFVQWLLYGMPAAMRDLPADLGHRAAPEAREWLRHGLNDLDNVGYDGPVGSVGKTLRLRFRLFALDAPTGLDAGADAAAVGAAMEGHVLETAELHTTYERSR